MPGLLEPCSSSDFEDNREHDQEADKDGRLLSETDVTEVFSQNISSEQIEAGALLPSSEIPSSSTQVPQENVLHPMYQISEYERIRLANIAEIKRLMKLQYPTFEDDVKALKVVERRKKTAPKSKEVIPMRKSSRLGTKMKVLDIDTSISAVSVVDADGDQVESEPMIVSDNAVVTLNEEGYSSDSQVLENTVEHEGYSNESHAEITTNEEINDSSNVTSEEIDDETTSQVSQFEIEPAARFACIPCSMKFR